MLGDRAVPFDGTGGYAHHVANVVASVPMVSGVGAGVAAGMGKPSRELASAPQRRLMGWKYATGVLPGANLTFE